MNKIYWVLIVALVLRVAVIPAYGSHLTGDEAWNLDVGMTLTTDHPLATLTCMTMLEPQFVPCPINYRPPLYPYLLYVYSNIVGDGSTFIYRQLRLFNAILGALIIVPAYLIGRHFYGEKAGLLAASFVALNPFLIYTSVQLTNRSLNALLLLVAYYLALKREWFYTGVWSGLAYLSSYASVFYFPVTFLILPKRRLAAAIIVCLVVVSPWLIRNTMLYGDPTFTPARYALTFHSWSEINTLTAPRSFSQYISDIGWVKAVGIRLINPFLAYVPLIKAPNPVEFLLYFHGIGVFTPLILLFAGVFAVQAFSRLEWNSIMSTIVVASLISPLLYGCLKAGGGVNEALIPLSPLFAVLAAAYTVDKPRLQLITILSLILQGILMVIVWG